MYEYKPTTEKTHIQTYTKKKTHKFLYMLQKYFMKIGENCKKKKGKV